MSKRKALFFDIDGTLLPFDRQALADYLCVDRSALSRTIGALQREGVLTVRRDRFTLNF